MHMDFSLQIAIRKENADFFLSLPLQAPPSGLRWIWHHNKECANFPLSSQFTTTMQYCQCLGHVNMYYLSFLCALFRRRLLFCNATYSASLCKQVTVGNLLKHISIGSSIQGCRICFCQFQEPKDILFLHLGRSASRSQAHKLSYKLMMKLVVMALYVTKVPYL